MTTRYPNNEQRGDQHIDRQPDGFEHDELIEALRGMIELIDHLHAYPKANPREFFFLRDGGEHGNIHAARAALAKHAPKFLNVSCSQCGQDFGPGDHGYSHCSNHAGKVPA